MSDSPITQPASNFIKPISNPNLTVQPTLQEPVQQDIPAQQSVPPQNPQPVPQQVAPQASNAATNGAWDALAAQQKMMELERINREQQAQLQQMQAKYNEQNTTIDNLLKSQAEYDNLKRFNEATNIDYSNLTTVDPADAKYISDSVIKAVQAQLDPIRQRLDEHKQQMQNSLNYQEQRFQQQQAANTLNKILAKHPDFLELRNNPNYVNFLNRRDGYSSQTIDQRAAIEFQLGNADYINNMLDQFKASSPNVNSIQTIAPVQTTSSTVAPAQPAKTLPTLQELNSMMQMRQITPEQYRDLLKQIRGA